MSERILHTRVFHCSRPPAKAILSVLLTRQGSVVSRREDDVTGGALYTHAAIARDDARSMRNWLPPQLKRADVNDGGTVAATLFLALDSALRREELSQGMLTRARLRPCLIISRESMSAAP